MGGLLVLPFLGLGLLVLAFPLLVVFLLVVTLGLRRRVKELEARLETMERAPGAGPPTPGVAPVSPPAAPASAPPLPSPELVAATAVDLPTAPPSLPPPAPVVPTATPAETGVGPLEGRLGGTWLNRVGALVLILGIGFFLEYAFDNDWIGPPGRVALGVLVGIACLLGGERLQAGAYRVPAQGLAAVGIAALYLSVYAAHGVYNLAGVGAALIGLVLVTLTGMVVAVRHDAPAIAVLASLGGFLTPIVLDTGTDAASVLFTYLAVLDMGILAMAARRRWTGLTLLAFAGTEVLYWGWLERWYRPERLGVALVAASGFFLLFAFAGLRRAPGPAEAGPPPARPAGSGLGGALLVLGAPTLYFLAARRILAAEPAAVLATLCLVLAVVYGIAGQWTLRTARFRPALALLHLALAVGFLTLALAVRFTAETLAIAWSVEALVLLRGGHRLGAPKLRAGALVVFALAWGRWFESLSDVGGPGWFLLANPALPATLAVSGTAALGAGLDRWRAREATGWEVAARPLLLVAAIGSLATLVTVELGQFRTLAIPPPYVGVVTTVVWMLAALPWLALARQDRTRVLLGVVTVVLVILGMTTLDEASRWNRFVPQLRPAVVNPRFLAALLLCVLYWLYGRVVPDFPYVSDRTRRVVSAIARGAAALLLLWNLSMEVLLAPLPALPSGRAIELRSAGLSVLWALYALVAMGIGLWRRSAMLRRGAIGLFGVTIIKVFVADLAGLDAVYRILSFVVLGVVLLLASFLYARYRRRAIEGTS